MRSLPGATPELETMKDDHNKPFRVIVFGESGVGKSGKSIEIRMSNLYKLLSITDRAICSFS